MVEITNKLKSFVGPMVMSSCFEEKIKSDVLVSIGLFLLQLTKDLSLITLQRKKVSKRLNFFCRFEN